MNGDDSRSKDGEECKKHLKRVMFKSEKLKYNFDAVNLRINKCLKTKLLKFNIFYIRNSLHH